MKDKNVFWVLMLVMLSIANCAHEPGSIVIHDTLLTGVWLAADSRAASGHRHPYTMTVGEMEQVLAGVQVEERDTLTGLGILGSQQGKPAFTRAEIARVSPHLVQALRKASPQDMATFYMVVGDENRRRAVTSGGLFVDQNGRLHLMLANWRSIPSGGQDYTMAMELDNREEPLLPVSPYRFRVGFHPSNAWVLNTKGPDAPRFAAYNSIYGDPAKSVIIDLNIMKQNGASTPPVP